MIPLVQVQVNGAPLPQGSVDFYEDRITQQTRVNIILPNLDGYAEYLKLCDRTPTLDHVMFNWHKEATA